MPLLVLPAAVVAAAGQREGWVVMWSMAVAIFAGCKWLTWRSVPEERRRIGPAVSYFLAWPGLDARGFVDRRKPSPPPSVRHWFLAVFKTGLGAVLIWYVAGKLSFAGPLVMGWVGLAGLILVLHCGLFHLLALAWQRAGVSAVPIMRAPLLATFVADFWGRRWNLAFRDFAHRSIFLPTRRWLGASAAVLLCFFVSGLLHELVISVPARAGYGLPTAYFVLQALAVFVERTAPFRKRTMTGRLAVRLFTIAVVLGPAWLLFHPPFVARVMLPFLHAIGAL